MKPAIYPNVSMILTAHLLSLGSTSKDTHLRRYKPEPKLSTPNTPCLRKHLF